MDSNTLTMLSSLVGLVTAVAALFTILEMKRQRVSSYKPELVIIPPVLLFEPSTGFPPLLCRRKDLPLDQPLIPVSVDCINIGAGAARDLLAMWEFDHQLAVAEVSPFVTYRGYSIWLEHGNTRIDFEEDGQTMMTSFTDPQVTSSMPYLLPVQAPENIFRIPLPPDYLLFMRLGIYCIPSHPSNEGARVALPNTPPLTLRLTYSDVGGARRLRVFRLQLRFSMFSASSRPDGNSLLDKAEATATVAIQRAWPWKRW